MSTRTMLSSVSNNVAASVFASSVLPTPVGPRKMNEPIGRQVEVVAPLGVLGGLPYPVDLLAQRLHLAQSLALGLPLGSQGIGLGPEVGQFAAQLFQPLLAGRIVLFGEGGVLDLEACHP